MPLMYSQRTLRRSAAEGRTHLDSIIHQLGIIARELEELGADQAEVMARRAALGPVVVGYQRCGIKLDLHGLGFERVDVVSDAGRLPAATVATVQDTFAEITELDRQEQVVQTEMAPLEKRQQRLRSLVLHFEPVILGLEARVAALDAGLPDPRPHEPVPDWHEPPPVLSQTAVMGSW